MFGEDLDYSNSITTTDGEVYCIGLAGVLGSSSVRWWNANPASPLTSEIQGKNIRASKVPAKEETTGRRTL